MLTWLAQILPPVFIVFICILFAFKAAALLAAGVRLHGISTLIGLIPWPSSGNFEGEGYISLIF